MINDFIAWEEHEAGKSSLDVASDSGLGSEWSDAEDEDEEYDAR